MHEDAIDLTPFELRTLCIEVWVPPWAKFGSDNARALSGLIEAAWNGRYWASKHVTFRNGANHTNATGGLVEATFRQWSIALGIPAEVVSDAARELMDLLLQNHKTASRPGQSWLFNT
jgi:hypothetical protein